MVFASRCEPKDNVLYCPVRLTRKKRSKKQVFNLIQRFIETYGNRFTLLAGLKFKKGDVFRESL